MTARPIRDTAPPQWKTALQMVGISALLGLRESTRLVGASCGFFSSLPSHSA